MGLGGAASNTCRFLPTLNWFAGFPLWNLRRGSSWHADKGHRCPLNHAAGTRSRGAAAAATAATASLNFWSNCSPMDLEEESVTIRWACRRVHPDCCCLHRVT